MLVRRRPCIGPSSDGPVRGGRGPYGGPSIPPWTRVHVASPVLWVCIVRVRRRRRHGPPRSCPYVDVRRHGVSNPPSSVRHRIGSRASTHGTARICHVRHVCGAHVPGEVHPYVSPGGPYVPCTPPPRNGRWYHVRVSRVPSIQRIRGSTSTAPLGGVRPWPR